MPNAGRFLVVVVQAPPVGARRLQRRHATGGLGGGEGRAGAEAAVPGRHVIRDAVAEARSRLAVDIHPVVTVGAPHTQDMAHFNA